MDIGNSSIALHRPPAGEAWRGYVYFYVSVSAEGRMRP